MLYIMGEVCYNQIGTYGFEAKREKERFTVVCPRCRQNLKIGHFALLFCRVRETNVQKCLPHVQHDHFLVLQSIILLLFDDVVAAAVVIS